jgi:hypothetical protein
MPHLGDPVAIAPAGGGEPIASARMRAFAGPVDEDSEFSLPEKREIVEPVSTGVAQARLWEALDKARAEIADDAARSSDATEAAVSKAEGVVLAVSSGLLTMLLRGGSLVAAAVSSLPMWRRVDPLAVLSLSEEERRKREREQREARTKEDEEGAGIGELLDDDDSARDAPEDENATADKDETD